VREVVLRVPRVAVENVLDRLLPIVPGGVREVGAGPDVELRIRGGDAPELAEIAATAGRWPHTLAEHEVSDDWRERRLADYEPDLIGGRLLVRPEWAPQARGAIEIEIVLGEIAAFGGGTHPTTRTCLEWLLELPPAGSFADLGCGTGVLAILAARLSWDPVMALDVLPSSVGAARENARRNAVTIEAAVADLSTQPPPAADALAANIPASIHTTVAARLEQASLQIGLISGFGPDEAAGVLEGYEARGLGELRRHLADGWVVMLLGRN
jgi:ribosomal protein L11 methyltransferase